MRPSVEASEKHKLLCTIPRCWYCGEEVEEPKEYAVCDDECWALLMRSMNQAWCDSQTLSSLQELESKEAA